MKRWKWILTVCLLVAHPTFAQLSVSNFSINSVDSTPTTSNPNLSASSVSMGSSASSETESNGSLAVSSSSNEDVDYSGVTPKMNGKLYNYPNPFSASEETQLGYELSKPMEVEIRVYNATGYLAYKQVFGENSSGGSAGYNRVSLKPSSFSYPLSAGDRKSVV